MNMNYNLDLDETVLRERWNESDVYGDVIVPKCLLYLSIDFIREFKDKINWKNIGGFQIDFTTEKGLKFILEFRDILEKVMDGDLK